MSVDEARRFFDHDAAVGESAFAPITREGNLNRFVLHLFTQSPSDLPHETHVNTGITVSFALPTVREREHLARHAPTEIGVLEAELRDLPQGEAVAAAKVCAWRCTSACRGPIRWQRCWSALSWPPRLVDIVGHATHAGMGGPEANHVDAEAQCLTLYPCILC
jgi:hypothetical protein